MNKPKPEPLSALEAAQAEFAAARVADEQAQERLALAGQALAQRRQAYDDACLRAAQGEGAPPSPAEARQAVDAAADGLAGARQLAEEAARARASALARLSPLEEAEERARYRVRFDAAAAEYRRLCSDLADASKELMIGLARQGALGAALLNDFGAEGGAVAEAGRETVYSKRGAMVNAGYDVVPGIHLDLVPLRRAAR